MRNGLVTRLRSRRDHHWTHPRISAYINGELGPAERRRLRRHAAECAECGPLLRALTVIVPELRRLRSRPRRTIAPDVIDRLRSEPSRPLSGKLR